ncbi:coiled-coil domain-containing protein 39-like [Centruroides sculpturatus]|uniref:coiled-coil domain-containing protein 39-like n=1 Tax=Centruroides sculpturatus TaxID=218467 RepID=UPI000C6D9354|nr:coiled-coil domain-containing protein 39-like [Centruroides sculpturatus]
MADVENVTLPENITNLKWEGKPIFPIANEENRVLSEELANVKKEIQDIQVKIDDQSKLNSLLENHRKDVIKEINSLKQVCQARKRELIAGENVHKLLLRERSWLEKHSKILNKEINSCKEKQEKCKASIVEQMSKKEKIQNDLHMDHGTLEKWLKESAKTEGDVEILEKYKYLNNARIRDLEVKIEYANKDLKHWKTVAKQINLEILSLQAELNRLAEDFKLAHQQRRDILNQIEKGIEKIRKKDNEINDSVLQLEQIKKEISRLEDDKKDRKRFLERSIHDNRNLENVLRRTEQELKTIRIEVMRLQKHKEDSNSELEIQRHAINNLTTKLSGLRIEKKEKEKQIEQKKLYLEHIDREKEKLDKDLEQLKEDEANEEKCFQRLEDDIKKAEIKYEKEKKKLNGFLCAKTKAFKELEKCKSEEKVFLNRIDKAKSDIKDIKKNKSREEAKVLQYQEELYKLDYQILKLEQGSRERKDGTSEQDEIIDLKATLNKLKKIHEERMCNLKFLNIHIRNNQEEIYRLRNKLQKTKSDQTDYTNKLQEIKLYISSAQNEYKKVVEERGELTIEECLLKAKLKRLQKLLDKKVDDVFSVQKENVQFESNVKRQLEELNARKNVLKCEIRQSDQERQMLYNKLNKYQNRTEALQTKYKCILSVLGLKDDDERKEIDLLIEAEQEKAKLRNDIYEESKTLEKMVEEVKGLKNSLKLVKDTNEIYKQWLKSDEDDDTLRVREMEAEKKKLEEQVEQKRKELIRVKDEIASLRVKNEELERIYTDMQTNLTEKNFSLEKISREIQEQEEKLSRSDDINYRLTLSAKTSNANAELQMEDVKIRLLKELYKQVINLIEEMCEKHPQIIQRVRCLFTEASLPLPAKISDKTSLRKCSWTSSTLSKLSTPASRSQSRGINKSSGSERTVMSTKIVSLSLDPIEARSESKTSLHSSQISVKSK